MAETKKTKTNKRLLSVFLGMVILMASLAFAGTTAFADFSSQEPTKRNVSLGSLNWSLQTIDGKTITKSTYSNKAVMLVFYRATMSGGEGLCYNSNGVISELAKSSWIANSDVQIIAVDVDENTKADVTAYKKAYAPNCDNIVFTYGSDGNLVYNLVDLYSNLNGYFSYTLAFCAVIKDNTLCYAWEGCNSAVACQQALSTVSSVPYTESSLDSQVKAVIADGSYQIGDARSMLELINNMRTGKDAWYWNSDNATKTVLSNVGKLTYDYALEQIAMRRAAELVLSYSHTRPDGTSCFDLFYDGFRSYGENIAYGYTTVQSMFDGWAEEFDDYSGQGHRRNMLNLDFTAVGIACFNYGGRLYWVQEFGYSTTGISDPVGNSLSAPKLSSVSAASKGVTIKWGAVAGAAKYRVYYKTASSGWTKLADTASTSYNWTEAKYDTKYTFTVRCVDKDGKTYTSSYDTTGISYTLKQIATPKLSSVSNVVAGVKVTWGKVTGASKYRVFYKTGNGSWTKAGETTGTSYTWTGAKNNTKYSFTVRCIDKDGKNYTSAYDTTGKSITFMSAPTVSVSNVVAGVKVSWGKVTGAVNYKVYRKTPNGSYKALGTTTSTSFVDKTAKNNTKYVYAVRCVTKDGKTTISSYNAGKSITFLSAPTVSVSNVVAGVKVSWGKVSGAVNYKVYRKTSNGSYKALGTTTSTSFVDKTAKNNTKYIYAVRCVTKDGKTTTSSYNAGKSKTFVSAPTFSVSNVVAGVKISWSKVSGASNYAVFRKTPNGSYKKIGTTTGTSYVDKTAKSGTKYIYTVRCASKDGKTYTSSYNAGKSKTFVPAPTFTVSKTSSGVQIKWSKVTGASNYKIYRKTANGSYKAVGTTTGTSFVDKTAQKGTKYIYTVRCVSKDGKTATSSYNAGKSITR